MNPSHIQTASPLITTNPGQFFRSAPLFVAAAVVLLLLIAPVLMAESLDPRLFQGENVWIKPLKFLIALAVYLGTLAFVAHWLPEQMTRSTWYRLYCAAVVFCVAGEMVWIGGAAAFGTASHFNTASPFMAAIYSVMGVFAVSLTSPTLVFGVALWRNQDGRLPSVMALALGIGLVLTFVLTVITAGRMAGSGSHLVGIAGARLPVMGWSRTAGDLRVAHFFATHAMHFIPGFGLVAMLLLPETVALVAVWIFSGAFVGFVWFVFAEALAGQPFLPWLG